MKTAKKLLCLILVLVMALGLVQMASAAGIDDFPDGDLVENREEFGLLLELGIFYGFEDGTLGQGRNITRAQAAAIITRLLVGNTLANIYEQSRVDTGFSDVRATHWASGLIKFCVDRGIIYGYGNGRFGPSDPVTIPQFAIMLMRALGLAKEGEFTGASYIYDAIVAGAKYGILTGSGDFTAVATRDQVGLFAFNALTVGAE